ncbi:MAG: methylated-DNA--[protein]-cysteine S-methyltransferase [Deltaproteobacteria bacterium]|nr:methylated-DNA--[protein]-cysteine S-methyltransferase [Deltaproteobacteria bacterium]
MNVKECNPPLIYYSIFKTKIGWCGLLRSERGILRIFIGCPKSGQLLKQITHEFGNNIVRAPAKEAMVDKIKRYCAGEKVIFDKSAVDWSLLTPFQKSVFKEAMKIPYGAVEAYSGLARKSGCPNGSRAVGNALAKNPFPLVVPCHRIIRGDGRLGGFSAWGGIALKERLLKLEGVMINGWVESSMKKEKSM